MSIRICLYCLLFWLLNAWETPRKTDKYVLLHYGREGFSRWKDIIISYFKLAVKYNRTAVEPCLRNSRISSCMHNGTTLRLSVIIDIPHIQQQIPHLRLITWSDYLSARQSSSPLYCIPKREARNFNVSMDIPGYDPPFGVDKGVDLNQASLLQYLPVTARVHMFLSTTQRYESCLRRNPGDETIALVNPRYLHLFSVGKGLNAEKLAFHPSQYTTVTQILSASGIDPDNYLVYQWRSESVPVERLVPCAEELMRRARRRQRLVLGNNHSKVVLLSDLSFSPSVKLWVMMPDAGNSSAAALISSLAEVFFKTEAAEATRRIARDALLDDTTFLTVWDLILAFRATHFVTCVSESPGSICKECTRHASVFARFIIHQRREEYGKSSETEW